MGKVQISDPKNKVRSCPWEDTELKWALNSSGPTKLVAKGRKDCKDLNGAMGGGNLGYAASYRQQNIFRKDWPDGSKDAEQCTNVD